MWGLTCLEAQVRTAWFRPKASLLLLVNLNVSRPFKEAAFVTHTKLHLLRAGCIVAARVFQVVPVDG